MLLLLATPAFAQQTALPPRAQQQPFGQPPPQPPPAQRPQQQQDGRPPAPIRQMFRGLLAIDDTPDGQEDVEGPVTGYGNDLLWDPPAALHARVVTR